LGNSTSVCERFLCVFPHNCWVAVFHLEFETQLVQLFSVGDALNAILFNLLLNFRVSFADVSNREQRPFLLICKFPSVLKGYVCFNLQGNRSSILHIPRRIGMPPTFRICLQSN
jgi:hypothetical protein